MKSFILSALIAVFAVGSSTPGRAASVKPAPPTTVAGPQDLTDAEQKLTEMINAERIKNNLAKLKVIPVATIVARKHTEEMLKEHYFSHESPHPEHRSPMQRFVEQLGHRPQRAAVAENLYYASEVDLVKGHTALMQSPYHRANILSAKYDSVGVGVMKSGTGEFYITEVFASYDDADGQPAPTNVAANSLH